MEKVVIDNNLVNYNYWPGDGRYDILMLHGWRSNGIVWKTIAEALQKEPTTGNIYGLDLPGFGSSSPLEDGAALADYVRLVESFIDKLELKNIVVIGHSFGGRVGIKLAATSNLIKKLILVDSAGLITEPGKKKILSSAAKVVKPFFKPKFMKPLRQRIYKTIGAEDYLATPGMQKTYLNIINEDLSGLLPKITSPTLIIWGDRDEDTPLEFARIMNEKITDSRLEILAEAGHFSFLDKPKEFTDKIKQFINHD